MATGAVVPAPRGDGTTNDRAAVYTWLMNLRAQVKLSTGYNLPNGVLSLDYVVVHDAPSAVVKEITDRFAMVALRREGLIIPLTPTRR